VNHEGVHFIDIPYAALKSLIPAQSPLAHLVAKK
jgi:hypothetical protein